MILHITHAYYVKDYQVAVSFNNGREGVADLSVILNKKLFKPLQNKKAFSDVTLDKELNTLVWKNGLDLAPEYIYFQAFKHEAALQSQFKIWGYIR